MRRIALLLALFAAALAAGRAATSLDLMREIISVEKVSARADELGLTPEQRAQVATALDQQRLALLATADALSRANDELIAALAAPRPDKAQVFAKFGQLAEIEAARKRARLEAAVQMKSLLTPEQIKVLAAPPDQPRDLPPAATAPVPGEPATIPELLQTVRTGIARWRAEGRDLTRVNALWGQFRRHAEAREHAAARQKLQELIAVLSAPPPDQPR